MSTIIRQPRILVHRAKYTNEATSIDLRFFGNWWITLHFRFHLAIERYNPRDFDPPKA